ncbi:MAG: Gfo/Idh/MocA family oxidoreductase [Chloroflexi bacterium]|nr:Gfo/Idh/MocA family oxidoreductase [Chloroflexota bacterium]
MNKNIAVIGSGYWGKNLVRNFAELGALHTVCDVDAARLKEATSKYPQVFRECDYSDLLKNKEIKGVVIATPAATHYSLAKECLLAGKDAFVEKPLSLKVEEGKELVALAEEKGRILMVGHLLEHHPAVEKLKELVDGGALGKIQYIYSNRLNLGKFRTEENILWSFAPHDISVILLLLGGEMPHEVSAHGGYYLHQDIADVTVTTMSFRSGARAHIFVSWLHPYKEQKLVVVGDRKMAEFNDTAQNKLLLFSHEIEWIDRKPVPHRKEAEAIEVSSEEPLRRECQNFIECIESRKKPKTDGRKGVQVLEILSHCQASLGNRGAIVPIGKKEKDHFVHESSVIEKPFAIGEGTKIWHFSHIMPNVTIGKNCVIGQNVFIGKGTKIGNNVKIQNNVSVFEGVTLEDDVFCGPSSVFTNVVNPRSHVSRKDDFNPTLVKKGASIGANATIVCGNTIGQFAFIGAGAVVTKDIPDYALVYGNPARIHGWMCECGEELKGKGNTLRCPRCAKVYRLEDKICSPLT